MTTGTPLTQPAMVWELAPACWTLWKYTMARYPVALSPAQNTRIPVMSTLALGTCRISASSSRHGRARRWRSRSATSRAAADSRTSTSTMKATTTMNPPAIAEGQVPGGGVVRLPRGDDRALDHEAHERRRARR